MANTFIQFRIDENDKKQATEILDSLGTNLSAVLNMTIKQIILQKRIPFDVALPEDHAVESVAASMAMEGLPLDAKEKEALREFRKLTQNEQEREIQRIVAKYTQKSNLSPDLSPK